MHGGRFSEVKRGMEVAIYCRCFSFTQVVVLSIDKIDKKYYSLRRVKITAGYRIICMLYKCEMPSHPVSYP